MDSDPHPRLAAGATLARRVAVVGAGRLGTALAAALADAGARVDGPLERDATLADDLDAVLLCVPDAQIEAAAAAIEPLGLHPLTSVPERGATFAGATAGIAGATPRARAVARELAQALGMHPIHVADEDHAAACGASSFLVTIEGVAAAAGEGCGGKRPHSGRFPPDPPAGARAGARTRTLRTVADLRAALAPTRRAGRKIGLVPTMGALHDGHLSLIAKARAATDVVVVSLFVNPAQFDDAADLRAYPRDEARDERLASEAGADILFAPPAAEVYPPGFATSVRVAGITAQLEGESRGEEHFAGVATVVAKLFNMAQPDVALFGQKDAQQVAVIRRLVRDLDIPVRIEVGETVREPDGLALSSRNARLRNGERDRAAALPRALIAARRAVAAGERDPACVAAAARAAMRELGVEPEYLELVTPDTFVPVRRIDGEQVLVAVAARVGDVRLIDNELLAPNGSDPSTGSH